MTEALSRSGRLSLSIGDSDIPALDAVRAVAVMLVMLYHFGVPYVNGAVGVEMFFVLSGFLITWLLLGEQRRSGTISVRAFYLRRVLRIFPAFYAFVLFAVGVEVLRGRAIPFAETVSALLYVSDYYSAVRHPPDSFVSHTWSLAIEEQFYLLWPAALLMLSRWSVGARIRTLIAVIVSVWFYRLLLKAGGVSGGYIYHAFDARLDQLAIGCLLASLLFANRWSPSWQAACANCVWPLLTVAALFASSIGDLSSTAYRDVFGFALEPVLAAILIVQLIALHRHWMWKWVQWRAVRFLGRLSYSLYLYQQITISVPDRWFGQELSVAKFLAAFGITLAFALGSYYVIERPFLRLKSKLKREQPSAECAAMAV
jgi:peptidoglycan/LPS O-acetylase OafA/YrhL